jgi:hypothetical protein
MSFLIAKADHLALIHPNFATKFTEFSSGCNRIRTAPPSSDEAPTPRGRIFAMMTARTTGVVRAVVVCALFFAAAGTAAADRAWTTLGDGLELGRFPLAGQGSPPATVHVLRVDPRRWELTLHGLPSGGSTGYTAREWSRREGLVAAINAGLYQEDYRTHSGYMRADGTIYSRGTNGYLSAAAFDPLNPQDPPFRLFDLDDDPLEAVIGRYRRVVQNLRMVKRPGENRWSSQERRWSEAALGEDREGRALLIFCGAPLPLDRLIDAVLALPLGLVAAQHLEGGTQAQLFVAAGGQTVELVGGHEGVFPAPEPNRPAWPIPNVIGVRARPAR